MKIIKLTQGTPEWLAHRREGIGSSDIAAILGKCKYRSAMDVFKDKIGVSDPIYVNPAMRRGQENEAEAGDWLSSKLQIQEYTNPCIEHPQFSFVRSSLDFYDAKSGVIGEIKVPMPKTFCSLFNGETAWDDYIDRYKFQLQWHMAVSGKEKIWFVVYSPEYKKAYTKEILRDDVLIKEMMDKATEFWNNLQAGILPECEDIDIIVLNPPEAKEVCDEYIQLIEKKKAVDAQLKILKENILNFGDDGDFKLWDLHCKRTQGRTSYDYKKMKTDGIDLSVYEKKGIGFYKISM